jgi:gas vesicle protein
MRDHDEIPYVVVERHGSDVAPFFWGLVVGAGIALLFAPRSGAETQEEIRARVRRVRDAAEDRVTGARDSVTDAVTRTRDRIQDGLDSGFRAARDARSELEGRVAQAKNDYRFTEDDLGQTSTPSAAEVLVADAPVDEPEEEERP